MAFTDAYPHYTREMARIYFDMKPEGLTLRGGQTSLAKLLKLDVVEQRDGRWRVVDPIFEKWLVK